MSSFPYDYTSFRFTPYVLNYIYEGQVYVAYHRFATITAGTSVYILLRTNNRYHHAISRTVKTTGTGNVQISLYEGFTVGGDGTPIELPPVSLDRRIKTLNPAQSVMTIPTTPNVTGATLISRNYGYSNAQGNNVGNTDFSTQDIERVYDKNSSALLQFTAVGGDVSLAFNYTFYESGN